MTSEGAAASLGQVKPSVQAKGEATPPCDGWKKSGSSMGCGVQGIEASHKGPQHTVFPKE